MVPEIVRLPQRGEPLEGRADDELMVLSARGLREAFETLVRRHARRVIGFCAKHLGDLARGEEMAQDVWLSVWNHRAEYHPEGKFVVWLFTLARNRLRNAGRDAKAQKRATPARADADEAVDLSPNALDRMLVEERRARVERSLAHVSDDLREAMNLRFAADLSYAEVARIQSVGESTARARVFQGLKELRRRLRGER